MKILVLGASGKVGRLVVEGALNRGHKVVAFIHSKGLAEGANLKVIKGDVYDSKSLDKALNSVDVVINCLGSWGTKNKDVVSKGIENLLPLAKKHHVKRIVSLTGHGAAVPEEKLSSLANLSRHILLVLAPKILRDGEKSIIHLKNSNQDWVVVRSPIMVSFFEPTKYIFTTKRPWPLSIINRKSVAIALLDLSEQKKIIDHMPFIKRGSV